MEANSISDFNLICRTCLCTGVELKSIFECNIVNMIHFCQLFKVQPNGEFPNQICLKCHKIITEYNNFKLLCEKSEETLQQLVKEKLNTHNATKTIEESKSNWLQCNQDYDNDIKPIVINTSIQSSGNKCDYCNKNFSNSQFLKKHLKNCHKNLECPKCEIYVPNLEEHSCTAKNSIKVEKEDEFGDLTTFLEADSGPPLPFSCTKCTQSFNNTHDLELHQTTHNTNGEFICTKCNKKYATRQMLKRHIKTHLLHKPHICKLCGKGFAESHALTKHTRKHTGEPREKKHCCSVCGQGFSEPFYLNVHMRKHTGERPLMCASCGKSFADPRSLKAHNMTHTGEKPYKCHICSKAFSQSVNLTKHIRVHTGEKPYVCSQCGKCFTQSSSLDKHSRIHSGLKPYACNTCPKKFSEKGTLIHHHRTHTGEKPYVCEQCGLAFASSSELKLHKRKHTGVKKNICNICGKDFATPSNLVVHSRSHTGEKPFACEFCAKAFADKSSLRKHIKIHEVKNGVEGNNFNVIENLQDFHLKDDNKVDINYYS